MTRGYRRYLTERKVRQRSKLISVFGLQQGTDYEIQREKINQSYGYLRDGNVTHFIACGWRKYYKRDKSKIN